MYITKLSTKNFNDEPVIKTLMFNLTETELWEQEFSGTEKSLGAAIVEITGDEAGKVDPEKMSTKDKGKLLLLFKTLMDKGYGVKSADGEHFHKEGELANFKDTQAYSDFFMKLIKEPEEASRFIQGVLPADFSAKAKEYAEAHKAE